MPILRTKKALKDLASGDTLKVLATDPGSVKDMESFCRTTAMNWWKPARTATYTPT